MMSSLRIIFRLAWRNLWRNHRRTLIMLAAIVIGVWAMIFMTALMRGMVDDMVKDGVIDPAKVTRGALENAASIAAMILTTEALITDIPEEEKAPMPQMPEY